MADDDPRKLGVLAKIILALIVVLIVAGIVEHGVTIPTFARIWHQLIERTDAPMRFRFVLQPIMAAIAAVRDGRRDAQQGRSPYFWTMLESPDKRVGRLEEGLNATARIVLLGLVMDTIYQLIVLHRFFPAEAVIVAIVFAFIPYVIIRGPVARIARGRIGQKGHGA
jgi:hypothetical protein